MTRIDTLLAGGIVVTAEATAADADGIRRRCSEIGLGMDLTEERQAAEE